MDKNFFESFLEDYFAECDEHLTSIKKNLLKLEEDINNVPKGVYDELFRSFHTIKGLSAMVGVAPAENLSHELESYLKLLKSGAQNITLEGLDVLREGVRTLEDVIIAKKENKDFPDLEKILEKLRNLTQKDADLQNEKDDTKKIREEKLGEERKYIVKFFPSKELSEKNINVELIKQKLEEFGKIEKVTPKVDENKKIYFEFVISTQKENLEDSLKDLPIILTPYKTLEETEKKEERREKTFSMPTSNYIRVDIRKLDNLMTILGELVITKSRLEGNLRSLKGKLSYQDEKKLQETVKSLDKYLRDLRESFTRIRLVPIGELFERMQFVIKDLIRESNKNIALEISGYDTELDKYIVERLMDPLLHIVRNAVSHGIEPEEERIKKGKDPVGKIYLRAYTSGDNVYVEVENDGREIDFSQVAKKALELGLIKDITEVDSTEKVLDILCHPDFSTRDSADRASGRGVGMAVVKQTINELGGKLFLKTDKNSTCFTLVLPLTLAIIDAIIITLGEQNFAVPESIVREIIEINTDDVIKFGNISLIPFRHDTLPIVYLSEVFNLKIEDNRSKRRHVLVIGDKKAFGVVVDKVVTLKEIVIRPINDPLIQNPLILGATDLGDGKLILILNLDYLSKSEVKLSV